MTFKDIISEKELIQLRRQFGHFSMLDINLDVSGKTYNYYNDIMRVRKDRRGEVALAIEGPSRRFLFHTKKFYPDGIYRIPTGGIHLGETVLDAVKRESYEETGLFLSLNDFLGIVKIQFCCHQQAIPFASYLFHLSSKTLDARPMDEEEQIAFFKWIHISTVPQIVEQLRSQGSQWHDWGRFRAIPHELLLSKIPN